MGLFKDGTSGGQSLRGRVSARGARPRRNASSGTPPLHGSGGPADKNARTISTAAEHVADADADLSRWGERDGIIARGEPKRAGRAERRHLGGVEQVLGEETNVEPVQLADPR